MLMSSLGFRAATGDLKSCQLQRAKGWPTAAATFQSPGNCCTSLLPPKRQRLGIRSPRPQPAAPRPLLTHCLPSLPLCVTAQILFRAKDLDPEPRSHVVRGNHTQSALLAGLGKFVLYELQVLAFTRIGNGVPSAPPILERTKDDGTSGPCLRPPPRLAVPTHTLRTVVIFNLIFKTLLLPSVQQRTMKQSCFLTAERPYGQFQPE